MNWQDYFPNAQKSQQMSEDTDIQNLPLDKEWLHIPKAELTDRERFLITLFSRNAEDRQVLTNPWLEFLMGRNAQLPAAYPNYQFLYLEHSQHFTDELLELLDQLLLGRVATIAIDAHRTALLLTQEQGSDITELLKELLVTIESDFGLSLSLFLGNSWARIDGEHLRQIFQAETGLFTAYLASHSSEKMQSFAKMLLWALSNGQEVGVFKERLNYYLTLQNDVPDMVAALWETHGNQVQAAQKLYLHRNSLQYKLDKFQNLSGLNLKKLDDLALCYWLLLEN